MYTAGRVRGIQGEITVKRKDSHPLIFWLFLAPVLIAFVVVIVVPFFLGVYYSFTNWSSSARAGNALRLIGLRNYGRHLQGSAHSPIRSS